MVRNATGVREKCEGKYSAGKSCLSGSSIRTLWIDVAVEHGTALHCGVKGCTARQHALEDTAAKQTRKHLSNLTVQTTTDEVHITQRNAANVSPL